MVRGHTGSQTRFSVQRIQRERVTANQDTIPPDPKRGDHKGTVSRAQVVG